MIIKMNNIEYEIKEVCQKEYNEEDVCDIVANSYEIIHNIIKMYFEKSY